MRWRSTAVSFVPTAGTAGNNSKKILQLKPDDYVLKPAQKERIFDVLKKHLGA